MSELYGESQRAFQSRHDTRRLADRLENLAHRDFDANDRAFIESVAFFFLSTVDECGRPTVSYKGGPPGFVRIVGANELAFPSYDGNGMFLSLGNIASTAQVGLLFIDFEAPRRLRVQGVARVVANDRPDAAPGAQYLVLVAATQVFVNCGRYIHQYSSRKLSRHLPDTAGQQPFPEWKRIDFIASSLSDRDQKRVQDAGGVLPIEAYRGEDSPGERDPPKAGDNGA
jgi:predicted pyridoxine 5'-phosphate oxidase superfamily flavin-nucleotide-binding protein